MGSEELDAMDRLLDGALSRYTAGEPREGLEARVLARVASEGGRRAPRWPWWAFAAAAAVACFAMLAVAVRSHRAPAPRQTAAVQGPVEPVRREAPPVVAAARPTHRKRAGARPSLPKQQTFPAPAGVSREERALLAFVSGAPEQAQQMLEAQQRTAEPIRIDEIAIEPLRSVDSK